MTPAGFARRYAAWSLDAALIAALATTFAWPWLGPALDTFAATFAQLVSTVGDGLFAGLMAGGPLPAIATGIARDPEVLAVADAFRRATWRAAWPFLSAYALLSLPWHVAGVASRWQASPGKRAFGLRVVGPEASPPTLPRAIARHLAAALSWLTLNAGHLLALGPKRAALHDRVAGTRVCRRGGAHPRSGVVGAWIAAQVLAALVSSWWLLRGVGALVAAPS